MTIEVVEKTFLILECLAQYSRPVSLANVAEKLNIPKPTIYRILQTLVELGYVAQDKKTGFYMRTTRLEVLGSNSHNLDLKQHALPIMKKLNKKFNETINLGVMINTQVHYVHFLHTTKSLRHMVKPDSTDSFYSTALGRAIVAYLPENEQATLINKIKLREHTPNTVKTKTQLRKKLHEVKKNGIAIDDEENDVGVICFGVPIIEQGYPIAAISISIPKSRCSEKMQKEIIKELKAIKL